MMIFRVLGAFNSDKPSSMYKDLSTPRSFRVLRIFDYGEPSSHLCICVPKCYNPGLSICICVRSVRIRDLVYTYVSLYICTYVCICVQSVRIVEGCLWLEIQR